jgi:LysR family nitrogen assimilation transcriptional regulator
MELRSIQFFVQIADEGSITRTAEKLGIAQPALTRHVKQLEAELGTELLTRLPRGVRLTTSGRDFLEHARRILTEVGRAKERVRGSTSTPKGEVIIGTSPTLAPLLLPGCIARTRQECPSVSLKVMEGFSPQLLDALLTGRLDIAVMTNPPRSPALQLEPLVSEPLVALGPPGARGAVQSFSLAELSRTPVVVSVGMRAIIDEQLKGVGAELRVEAEIDSIEAIRRLLVGGLSWSLMPISAFHAEIANGNLAAYPIEGANLHRILVFARPKSEARSAAAEEIERVVRAEMAALGEAGLFKLPPRASIDKSRLPARGARPKMRRRASA